MFKKVIIFLILTAFIYSCTEESIVESQSDQIVVEAFLYAGETINDIHLTKTLPLGSEDTIAPPVNDAQVNLIKNGKNYLLKVNPLLNGYYFYDGTDLKVESGDKFQLEVNYYGKKITAETIVPRKPEDVTISKNTLTLSTPTGGFGSFQDTSTIFLKWTNTDSSLYYVVIENLETNPVEILTGSYGRFINRRMTFPPIATSEFLIGRRNLSFYGNHKAIIYKVNQEYADLYESRNQDSRNLNEPLTNIKNGLGVFSSFASDNKPFVVISQ